MRLVNLLNRGRGVPVTKYSVLLCALSVARATAASELAPSCIATLSIDSPVQVAVTGAAAARRTMPISPRELDAYAVEEAGVDVFVKALDARGKTLAIFDNPIARSGVQIVPAKIDSVAVATLEFEGKEHKALRGQVLVRSLNFNAAGAEQRCAAMIADLSRADRDFGAARAFRLRRAASSGMDSNALFARSDVSYVAARRHVAATRVQDTAAVEAMLAALHYYSLEQWRDAADWASAAAVNFGRVGAGYAGARSKAMLAASWMEMATSAMSDSDSQDAPQESARLMDKARDLLRELEGYFGSRKDVYFTALQTNNIGLAYYYQAEFALALPYFRRAETAFRAIAESQRAGLATQNIALCDWGQGRLTAAVAGFSKALQSISATSEPNLYVLVANNLGLVSYAAGQYDQAQKVLSRAYQVAEVAQIESFRARSLYGLAITQYALGDKESVEKLLGNVLQIWTPQLDARGRVAALRALAAVRRDQGRMRDAMRFSREALALAAAPSARGRILLDIAEAQSSIGDAATALDVLAPIANGDGSSDPLLVALARMTRGGVLRRLGQFEAAKADLSRALPLFRELQDVNAEFRCLLELARVNDSRGDRRAAVLSLEQALELSDEIRGQTANPEYRASLATGLREAQELRLRFYWQDYRTSVAQQNAVKARATAVRALALADSLRGAVLAELRRPESGIARGTAIHMENSQREVLRQIAELRYQLTVRYDRAGSDDKTAMRLRAKVAELRARLGSPTRGVAVTAQSLRRRQAMTEQRMNELGRAFPGRAFVEYWLGDQFAFAWVLRDDRADWLQLEAPGPIRDLTVKYSQVMSNSHTGSPATRTSLLEDLHRSLLQKLAPLLDGAQELVVVPDGPLALVSFGTLRDKSQNAAPYLIQRAHISVAPALGLADARGLGKQRPAFRKDLLLVADPVYEPQDPRFRDNSASAPGVARNRSAVQLPGGRKFRRLVWSGQEAESISKLLAPGRIDRLTGFAADMKTLANRNLGDYRFLHFAVHATTDYEVPQLSAVILSQFDREGRVVESEWRSGDFADLGIQADAVILSACSSAAGRNIAGEGVLGLQYAALAGGARSVIATYWEVQDEITAQLMTETYRRMLSENDSPSRAVGNAIRNLLQAQPDLSPALWGAFATYTILPRELKTKG